MASTAAMITETLVGLQTEICVFVIAIAVHTLVFGKKRFAAAKKPKVLPSPANKQKGKAASPKRQARSPPPAPAVDDRAALLALRSAISSSDLEEALRLLPTAAMSWSTNGATPSAAPEAMLNRLLNLACSQSKLPALLEKLEGSGLIAARTAETLMAACAHSGTSAEAKQIMAAARSCGVEPTIPMYCSLLKSLGSEQRISEAKEVFESCPVRSTCLRNALLDICVTCGDLRAAERAVKEAQACGEADVVTHNTIIKAYLNKGDTRRVRSAIEVMRADGLSPDCVTFNELIDAAVKSGGEDVWGLMREMRACGLQPNQVTCSILLKGIQRSSKASDVERTLEVLGTMSESMDEVLLSSVCEACIRSSRADLLREQLRLQRQERRVQLRGPHTFGSVIRAYGFVGDLQGVWDTWNDMRARNILPTSITTGCMVEALVVNDGPDAGYALIRKALTDEKMRPLVNVIIYNSVLKGFSQRKQFDRVWEVHREMMEEGLQLSVTTYNTLVDACARSCDMARIPALLEEMHAQKVEPNVITYSTILKGYCQENRLDKAFQLLDEMKRTKDFSPDEIAYNTLLDGCARYGLFDRGMEVLQDMEQVGLAPSNFTLSVLVKLANRSHRVDKAFTLCEDLSKKYRLRLNVHVYNNLMQACTAHHDLNRAMEVFEQSVRERVRPDARSYTILLRGCVAAADAQRAAGLIRSAFNLPGEGRLLSSSYAALQQPATLPVDVLTESFACISGQPGNEASVAQLVKDVRGVPGVKLDSKALLQLASKAGSWRGKA